MKVTRSEIVRELQSLWPQLVDGHNKGGHIWIDRNEYWCPSKEHFQRFVNQSWKVTVENVDYDIKRFACGNFARTLSVMTDFHVLWLVSQDKLKYDDMLEWAVAEVKGRKFRGQPTSHAVNLILLDSMEFYFFEPQTDYDAWKADSEKDEIHFYSL